MARGGAGRGAGLAAAGLAALLVWRAAAQPVPGPAAVPPAIAASPPATTAGPPGLGTPARLPAVRSLRITANGARGDDVSGDETAANCARFRLRPREVRAFLATAHRVDSRAYHHDLDMSRCRAEGRVTFADGRRARWRIDRERRGLLLPEGGAPVFLFCPRCTARAFEPPAEPDRDG